MINLKLSWSLGALGNEYKLSIWPQLILLSLAQLFNHWMDRSLKIFAVYIDADLGISLSTLSYILMFGSYGPVLVFFTSNYYHYFDSNVILFIMEFCAALTMFTVYIYGYQAVWMLFICRLLYSFSLKGIFTYTNTMVAYYVSDPQDIVTYLSIFNSAFVLSTFLFVLTGYIINRSNGLFDYFFYSFTAFVFSMILLVSMPRFKTATSSSLMTPSQHSFANKVKRLFCCNPRYVSLLVICFFEMVSQNIFNISIGVFIKENYDADAMDLGLYTTLTQGLAQTIGIICIAVLFGRYIKNKHFVLICAACEMIVYGVFYVMIRNNEDIYIGCCLAVMFFVSLGHMGLFYGLVIVLIRTIPKHQQSIGSAIWSVMAFVGGSFGDFVVARVAAYHANDIGLYSSMLVILYGCCTASVIMWCYLSKDETAHAIDKGETDTLNATKKTNYKTLATV